MANASLVELILFLILFSLERLTPARKFQISNRWFLHLTLIMFFAFTWFFVVLVVWSLIPNLWTGLSNLSSWLQILIAYLVYSFIAYWYHRIRHITPILWRYIHYMHHSPAHMDTRVTFWRHPLEIILDSIIIIIVGKLIGVSIEVMICVLIVESSLELFHHCNIHTPKKLRWIGYFIQLPEQHLIHHQRGLHRWNYGTVTLWDTIFRTVRIPQVWSGKVGLPEWNSILKLLLYRY